MKRPQLTLYNSEKLNFSSKVRNKTLSPYLLNTEVLARAHRKKNK